MHLLRISQHGAAVRDLALVGEVTIGRHPRNTVSLRETQVSNEHAKVVLRQGDCFVEDLGSTNGTAVDGVPLPVHEPRPLAGGEKIAIGSFELQYLPEQHAVDHITEPGDDVLPKSVPRRMADDPVIRALALLAFLTCLAALATVVVKRLL